MEQEIEGDRNIKVILTSKEWLLGIDPIPSGSVLDSRHYHRHDALLARHSEFQLSQRNRATLGVA